MNITGPPSKYNYTSDFTLSTDTEPETWPGDIVPHTCSQICNITEAILSDSEDKVVEIDRSDYLKSVDP